MIEIRAFRRRLQYGEALKAASMDEHLGSKWKVNRSSAEVALQATPTSDPIRRENGLDILRVVAMFLVTTQHAFSLTAHDHWTNYHSLNAGQLGVAFLIGISGFLASISHRQPIPWLAQRLRRLYPSYWLAMVFCFILAGLAKHKHFTFNQFVSQMLGLGLFTHPNNLVNTPTWFVSIILVCYFFSFLIRRTSHPFLLSSFVIAVIISWDGTEGLKWPWMHLLTFFAAYALAIMCPENWRVFGFIVTGIVVFFLSPWSIAFSYSGISLISIGVTLWISMGMQFVRIMAEYSYEYYLVHGVCLFGMTSALRDYPVIAVAGGVSLALYASVLLYKIAGWVTAPLTRRYGSSKTLAVDIIASAPPAAPGSRCEHCRCGNLFTARGRGLAAEPNRPASHDGGDP